MGKTKVKVRIPRSKLEDVKRFIDILLNQPDDWNMGLVLDHRFIERVYDE